MALVALGIVARLHREWIVVDLSVAAKAQGVSTERLSRLVSRAIEPFEKALALLTRRGRPAVDMAAGKLQAELTLCRALLEVAGAILEKIPLRRRVVGALVVGAWLRLRGTPGLTQKQFCQALSIPPRTLRSWMSRPPRNVERTEPVVLPPSAPTRPRRRGPRRPRFGFDLVLPDTQLAADTTELSAFGVSLKLVAAQDVGGRDHDLLDSIIIDDRESSELVVSVLTQALTGKQGAQVIVDQGTPYMAAATVRALDDLEAEHAPQREGDPQAKSTIERAFETVKVIAGPLLRLTDRLASSIPALHDASLARATARLVVTSTLRAYQAGARAATRAVEARGSLDSEELARRAAEHREQARATDRSARLLLGHIHDIYRLPGASKTFVNSLRRYPLEVLEQAEKAFRAQVHRDDIRDRCSYFAALVRTFHTDYQREQARLEREREQARALEASRQQDEARRRARRASPIDFLRQAIEAIAAAWLPEKRLLLFGGRGVGIAWLERAISWLIEDHDAFAARDLVMGVFADFSLAAAERLGSDGITAVRDIVVAKLDLLAPNSQFGSCRSTNASTILGEEGPKQRPPPSAALRK
jgi:transposase InsO family protein